MSIQVDAFWRELKNFSSTVVDPIENATGTIKMWAGSIAWGRRRDPLGSLRASTSLREELDKIEPVLVARARMNNCSWGQIAAALGKTRQAVHKTYSSRS